jgi:hypothetical protein
VVILAAICAALAAAVAYYLFFLISHGYLPTPFIYDKFDTFMDLFNTMDWGSRDDRYTVWKSVYPPLSFLFVNALHWLLIGAHGIEMNSILLREEGMGVILFFVASYLFIPAFVVTREYWKAFSIPEKILIYFIGITSTPMLFALERGNLVIFALLFLPLLFTRSAYSRLAALAMLVNLKPYFILLFLVYVIKRQWNNLAVALGMAGGLYLLTSVILDSDLLALPGNLIGFSQNALFSYREVLAMPSSVSALSYVLESYMPQQGGFSRLAWLPVDPALIGASLDVMKWAVQAWTIVVLARVGKALSTDVLLAMLLVMITNMGMSVGGYTLIFYFALLPVFSGMRLRWGYLAIIALMSLPLDLLTLARDTKPPQRGPFYFSGVRWNVEWTLGAGSVVRPLLNLLLLALMAWEFAGARSKSVGAAADATMDDCPSLTNGTKDDICKIM